MLKKSLCLVLGFMCIGDMFGSPKELPLGSFNSSGENDLSLCDDSNMYRKETASTRKSLSDVNTQQKKKSRIEECKTNTSKNESKIITIDNDGQKNSDINNVTEYPIDEKEAISSDSNIEPNSGSGSNSNESSFSEDTEVTKNSINEENFTGNSSNSNTQSNKGSEDVFSIYVLSSYIEDLDPNDDLKKPENVLIIQKINKTLENYIDKKDVQDLYFLNGLLRMLNSFPDKLSSKVKNKIRTIITSLDYYTDEEINSDAEMTTRRAKALIYDYIYEMDPDSLGELNI